MKALGPVDLIRSDLFRYTGRQDWRAFVRAYRTNRGLRFSTWLRLTGLDNRVLARIARWQYGRLAERYHLYIDYRAKIGPALYLGHGTSVVVNASATLGANCNLSQFVTIGANRGRNAATLGDNVYVGPNACIVNTVTIGDGARIGAGAVVVDDIAPMATAVGNPARAVKTNDAPWPTRYPWIGPETSKKQKDIA